MKRNISKIELLIAAIIAVILVVVLPALNAAGVVSNFTINLWGKYLCYGLLAISRRPALGLHRPAQPRPGALLSASAATCSACTSC